MKSSYDQHYQTQHLFGAAVPELLEFFAKQSHKGSLLDVGCGQGRNAIPLAEMGYQVTGVDNSVVGIRQMMADARALEVQLSGIVENMYAFKGFGEYEYLLFDSMFHFTSKDRLREQQFIQSCIAQLNPGTILVFSIPDTGKKQQYLAEALLETHSTESVHKQSFTYTFTDQENQHTSTTPYHLLAFRVLPT